MKAYKKDIGYSEYSKAKDLKSDTTRKYKFYIVIIGIHVGKLKSVQLNASNFAIGAENYDKVI